MNIIANDLIPVYENNGQQAINTRDLHEFLDVASKYADWIKNRFEKFGLTEGEDYEAVSNFLENGGRSIDYIVPVDVAKELAMVENNDKGRDVRRYFIAVEKKFRAKPLSQLEILAESAKALVEHEKRIGLMERKQEAMIEALTAPAMMDWSTDMNSRINAICKSQNKNYQTYRHELYAKLEATGRCNLKARQTRLRERMRQAGHKYSDVQAVTQIHVIADDPKLRAIFEGIIKTEQVKYIGEVTA
jgi:phage anti-repressor protein